MAVPSIEFLVRYLERERSEDDDLPWNKLTCLAVVCYVIKKKHGSSKTIGRLNSAAEQYLNSEKKCIRLTPRKQEYVGAMKNRMQRISQLFINSFIPQAQMHFTVPQLDHLSDKDKKNLNRNEILASFLDFLVQILHREANVDTAREKWYAPLRKSLLFLLAVLGDKPFGCSTLHSVLGDQVKDLLVKFEALANEAGRLIYSCIFSVRPFDDDMFYAKRSDLLEKFVIMNAIIEQYCEKFSELPALAVPVSNVVDSFFIIHSLVDDLDRFSAQDCCPMKDQISIFHDELRASQALLKFIEAREDDGAMKEPLDQIRDLAYEAEYLINSHVVGSIHAWYLDLRLHSTTQNLKLAREKLQRIKEKQHSKVVMHYSREISDITPAAAVDDDHFVELQDNTTERILEHLVGYKKSREIISIYGMPGLGKTTIANKLYHCSSASSYFDRRAWCVVSQTYSVRSLLINILIHVARELKKDEILKKSEAELGLDIHKSLKQRRYLIVLDDVWHSNAWYSLQIYLPDDGNGSRVILTSRIKDAAPDGSIYHGLHLFSEDQCWNLLKKKMFPGESCPPELLNIGRRIAAKCSGIPLAVVVTAGILTNLKRDKNEWERVEEQLDVFLSDGQSDYRKIVELSYEHLPHNLKPCFLYFAAFPEDAEISVIKLAWLWISEGFIPKNEGKTPEKVAEMYLLELMNRSLVIPGKRRAGGGTKTCRIHDLLLDVCVKKVSEENFLNSDNELSIYEKHQRSYLPHTWNIDSRPFGLYCRSLIGGLLERSHCFQTRALLKVLDIMPNRFQKFDGTSFDIPIHLRYLGVNHLTNKMVANLDNLEFINVVTSSQVTVPSIILRMKKLRHLIVRKEAIFDTDGYISEKTNLRTLLYVCIYKRQDEMILRDSPHLLKLKCIVGSKTTFPDLSFLEELETLKIVLDVTSIYCSWTWSSLNIPSTIKNLCLSNTNLPWKEMSVIGRLPNLCVLKLEYHAFVGNEWVTVDDEFKELRFLKIEQSYLKHWTSCSEHFPKLERLVLFGCMTLEEIPFDLWDSSTLQRIDVTGCLMRACISAVRIEQEQREDGNEELHVNIIATYWTKQELVVLYKEKMEIAKETGDHMYELSSIICSAERDFLVRSDGEQIEAISLKGKIVGIYFSTYRLESCQLFTRKLVRLYNELKKYGHFEIVFVSGDKDVNDESSVGGFSKLPWPAIPLADLDTRNKLNELFNVQGLPHLVILDGYGKVLTEEGVRIVEEEDHFVPEHIPKNKKPEEEAKEHTKQLQEEEGEAIWNDSPEYLLLSKTQDYVIDNSMTRVPVSRLFGKTTMLFFGAQWCPPCQNILRKLVQAYQEINENTNHSVEVIFIDNNKDRSSFDEFFAMMPWLALPFNDDRIQLLIQMYNVNIIPKLVVIGPTGKTVTIEGTELILLYGAEAYPFTSERVKEIESENDKMAELWPKKVTREVHEHELGLAKHARYVCDGCHERGCNWAYYCEDCDFDLHPKCALGNDYKSERVKSWPDKAIYELEEPKAEVNMNDSLESLLVSESRDYVIDKDEIKIPVSNLVGKTTLLFFAASWCPPCQFVLTELVQKYQENKDKNNTSVEVIFISSDKDQSSFDDFFAMMPWLALPFHDDRIKSLSRMFKAIPMLVTIEPTGKIAESNAWELISYPWEEAYPFTYEWVQSQTKAQQMVIFWPKKVTNKLHDHELCLIKQILYDCDGCHEAGLNWSYRCEDCLFSLHPNCCLRDDKALVTEESEGEEKKTDTTSGEWTPDGYKCCKE